MPRFRKRPVEVDAIQWTGDNEAEIAAFTGHTRFNALDQEDREHADDPDWTAQVFDNLHSTWVGVYTGQWIIRGVKNEFYPCAEDVFAETYEIADAATSTKAALIEIVETDHSTDDGPGVIIPNQVRINGTPLLIPSGQQIKVHSITVNDDGHSEDPVCVTLTLFARRVVIAAEGDL